MFQLTPLNDLDRLRGRPRRGVKSQQKEILVIGFYTTPRHVMLDGKRQN
jgi:hypothetical protein